MEQDKYIFHHLVNTALIIPDLANIIIEYTLPWTREQERQFMQTRKIVPFQAADRVPTIHPGSGPDGLAAPPSVKVEYFTIMYENTPCYRHTTIIKSVVLSLQKRGQFGRPLTIVRDSADLDYAIDQFCWFPSSRARLGLSFLGEKWIDLIPLFERKCQQLGIPY